MDNAVESRWARSVEEAALLAGTWWVEGYDVAVKVLWHTGTSNWYIQVCRGDKKAESAPIKEEK